MRLAMGACGRVWARIIAAPEQVFQDVHQHTMKYLQSFTFFSSVAGIALSTSITDIQGPRFLSPLAGQQVQNVTGVVVAKGPSGFWIRGDPVPDIRVSNGLNVYSTSSAVLNSVSVGDFISVDGTVTEFRSASSPNNLRITEIERPTNIRVLSSNHTFTPIILGKDRSPPTQLVSSLDKGRDGFLSVPNNASLLLSVNPELQPDRYGLDFWESLEGQLVTVPKPVALGFQNNYGEFWVHGDWPVTGKNSRGGLTLRFGPDGVTDGNPEAVMIGAPLDGTRNPQSSLGATLGDITGIVAYQFGFFYVLPLTAPQIAGRPDPIVPASSLISSPNKDCDITFGDYNVENLAPTSSHLPTIAAHIKDYLKTPDIVFVQEIQDNSGPTNDGTVSANITLTNLVNAIAKISDVTYDFVEIEPVDGQDGGIPGGNIRQAYLYNSKKLSLVPGSPAGSSLDAVKVGGHLGKPVLNFNPGRIEPTNAAWNASRKPLVAAWQTPKGRQLFTVNLHLASKGGSSSTQGDARPPVNSGVDVRTNQISLVSSFVGDLLLKNPLANILIAGDFNEFVHTRSAYKSLSLIMNDIDDAANIPDVERYSYVFDQNSQQLDHAFVSWPLRLRGVEFEHIHVNTWSPTLSARISDHDPSAGRIKLC